MIQNESLSRDRDKEGSGKRMKRRISKRIIAIGVSLCVAFSIMPLPVSAEAEKETGTSSAQSKENPWVSTGRTFSINRVYSAGDGLLSLSIANIMLHTLCETAPIATSFGFESHFLR